MSSIGINSEGEVNVPINFEKFVIEFHIQVTDLGIPARTIKPILKLRIISS